MKLVAIVGTNAKQSYNRSLLQFMQRHFATKADIEILEITDVPMFNETDDQTDTPVIQKFNQAISEADGVIISTPEHNHTIPSSLNSLIEWLSFNIHPLDGKPTMIVGASYDVQGSSRAQLHLRQILDAPGVNATVMPGSEFLLGRAHRAFPFFTVYYNMAAYWNRERTTMDCTSWMATSTTMGDMKSQE